MRRLALFSFVAVSAVAAPAAAQTPPGAPPRAPGEIGPTPTNPGDTGFGTTQGTNPGGVPGVVPTVPNAPPPTVPIVPNVPPPSQLQVPTIPIRPVPGVPSVPPGAQNVPPAPSAGTLPAAILPRPGGLTADGVAQRALRRSYAIRGAQANVIAAQAAQAEAGRAMIPQVSVSFRYTRLSEFPPAVIPQQNIAQGFTELSQTIDAIRAGQPAPPTPCISSQFAAPGCSSFVTFQAAILNQYALRASITVPLSDIPLRLLRFYEAAGYQAEAARLSVEVQRSQVATAAREAWYDYVRALGQAAVTQTSFETTRRQRDDVARAVEAGTLARAELLRADANLADRERLALFASNALNIAEAILRQRARLMPEEQIVVGEAFDTPVTVPTNLVDLIQRATRQRPDVLSFDRQMRAIDANHAATRASQFPSLAAVGNLDYANPNPRIFPQTAEFRATWDVNLQATWSPTQAFTADATLQRLNAQREQLYAQQQQLREGIELDVRAQWIAARNAQAQVEANRTSLASAEEAYRVLSERFRAGAAVQTDLFLAETALLTARLNVVTASVELRVAMARLRRALGEREQDGPTTRPVPAR